MHPEIMRTNVIDGLYPKASEKDEKEKRNAKNNTMNIDNAWDSMSIMTHNVYVSLKP